MNRPLSSSGYNVSHCSFLIMQYLLSVLLFLSSPARTIAAVDDTTLPDLLYFYAYDCEHCQAVEAEFLPGFLEKYGDDFNFIDMEVHNPSNRDSLYAFESRVNVPEKDKDYPAVYFLGTMLEGEKNTRNRLSMLIEQYRTNPDSAWAVHREVMARKVEQYKPASNVKARTVHILYLYKQGCSECSRASEISDWLTRIFAFVEVDTYDIAKRENMIIATAMGLRKGVPEDRLMSTPQFFIGDHYVLAEDISRKRLSKLVNSYADTGTPAAWLDLPPEELASTKKLIREKFDSFSILAVGFAGLGDGINPCAFATILFLVSYLGIVGRTRREILLVGFSFAAAVFATYFFVGLGFFRFVQSLADFSFLAEIIFGGTAVLCLIFGVLSITDYIKARRGLTSDMSLQLPTFLKKRIHKTIREQARMDSIIGGALAAGFMVSILELACTGQIYLPTIVYMVGTDGYTSRALLFLLLYNICFILPLLVVFGIVYFGVSSRTISKVMESNVGSAKLVMAFVFFVLSGLLIWTVLH